MVEEEKKPVETDQIKEMLDREKPKMKRFLSYCAHCSICAESCFLYMTHDKDPQYMPSFKVIHSLGTLYKKKGNVDRDFLESIKGIIWRNCVLCRRCYCPIGVDIPRMIALARRICRSQGVCPDYGETDTKESWL